MIKSSKPILLLLIILAAIFFAIVTYIHWATDKGVAVWTQVVLVFVDLLVLFGFALSFDDLWDLIVGEKTGRRRRSAQSFVRDLVSTRKWPIMVVALANAIMFVGAIIPFLNPASAVESQHGKLEQLSVRTLEIVEQRLDRPQVEPPVVKMISGFWGEDGCRLVYRFTLSGAALHIDRVKAPSDAPPYNRVGTVIGVPDGYVMNTRNDDEGPEKGVNTTFTLEPGGLPTLSWQDRNSTTPTVLKACPDVSSPK